jgi:hypothetical protein
MGYSGNLYAQATEVITSQGDLRRGDSSGNPERLAIGSSGKVLQSNGTTESWQTLTTADSVLTTQGDILVEGSSGLERLGQSTDGYILTTKGASANPVWSAPAAGATVTVGSDIMTADETTTSSTFSDTALALTCQSSGKFFSTTSLNWSISNDTACYFRFTDGTTDKQRMQGDQATFAGRLNIAISCTGTSASQVVNIEFQTAGHTLTLYGQNDQATSRLDMMEVS